MTHVYICAYHVAFLIGNYRFFRRDRALLLTILRQTSPHFLALQAELQNDPETRALVNSIKTSSAMRDLPCLQAQASTDTRVDAQTIRQNLQAQRNELSRQLEEATNALDVALEHTVLNSPEEESSRNAVREAQTNVEQLTQINSVIEELLVSSDDRLNQEARQAQTVQRGVQQEATILDQVALREGQEIYERNQTFFRHNEEDFTIIGKVDGIMSDHRVVEVKTRTKWYSSPPQYDIVQLQVYLKLTGLSSGILEERLQSNMTERRETPITCPDADWHAILAGLRTAVRDIQNASVEGIKKWQCWDFGAVSAAGAA